MNRLSDNYEGLRDNLRISLDGIVDDLDFRGYSGDLESVAAGIVVGNNPSLWNTRVYPFSLNNLKDIEPKLSEALYCLDVLKEFTLESDSPHKGERVKFIETVKAVPLKHYNKIRNIDEEIKLVGGYKVADNKTKESIFLDSRPPNEYRFGSDLALMMIGMDTVIQSAIKRNMVKKGRLDAVGLNQRIEKIVRDIFLSHRLSSIDGIRRLYSKKPNMMSELTWAIAQKREADILGLEKPLMETNDHEIIDVIYVGPQLAFSDFQEEGATKFLMDYMKMKKKAYGNFLPACWPEMITKLAIERLTEKTLRKLERDVNRMQKEWNRKKIEDSRKQEFYRV